ELLFRSGLNNAFQNSDPEQATAKVITDAFSLFNLSGLTEGKRAFINVTRDTLLKEYLYLIPKELIVAEILETIEPDQEVIAACRKLKEAGYLLALDDFVYRDGCQPLVEMADFIKVDFLAAAEDQRRDLFRRFSPSGAQLLAEKVETEEAFSQGLQIGYPYFQGYFFCRPTIFKSKDIPGFKLHYFQVLQEILRPEMDFGRLEKYIKQEVSLSYRLLRYINSAFFGLKNKINSIKQALALLGEKEIKKWLSMLTLANMGKDKPDELAVHTIARARFCESLAPLAGLLHRAEDLFLVGMFSLIDAFLDRPLPEVLEEIPIKDEIRGAILGEENKLTEVYRYAVSYEKGDWGQLAEQQVRIGVDEERPPKLYRDSLRWGNDAFRSF
ncbi:MAG TPA: HDOD domain-containing protein, partial [Thermodesulfobacteriota bacterium]|nr:HDOD domain-containing protein [Thermodesulfobacteriota bacterium]